MSCFHGCQERALEPKLFVQLNRQKKVPKRANVFIHASGLAKDGELTLPGPFLSCSGAGGNRTLMQVAGTMLGETTLASYCTLPCVLLLSVFSIRVKLPVVRHYVCLLDISCSSWLAE